LSVVLSILLKLWGDFEDASPERIHAKLRNIAKKLEVLGAEGNNNAVKTNGSLLAHCSPLSRSTEPHGSSTARDGLEQSPNKR
jgi:hypothetical protein